VNDLVDAGYVTRKRVGRRNRYEIGASLPFRHPYEHRLDVGTLLAALRPEPAPQDAAEALAVDGSLR
jgi:hypothetical protein